MILPFKFDPCVVRDIMLSNGSLKSKQRILKSIIKWKLTIAPSNSINQLKSDIINDNVCYISIMILQNYKEIYKKIESYNTILTIDSCTCEICATSMTVGLKSANVKITDLSTDDDLSYVLFDLIKYANHGLVNHKIVDNVGWGTLSCIIKGDKNVNIELDKVIHSEKLLNGAITYSGNNIVKNLSNILLIHTNDMISFKSVSLNNRFTKIVLLLNIILEYMITIMLYRVIHVKKIGMYSEFVFKILNTVLEASGVYYYQIQISDVIENELTDLILSGSKPIYTIHTFLQIISVILDRMIKK
ncbi:protein O1 [BeAn 58058 virus]|uniref:protein O1 n=1 Tax=BeAn 58058 virus TaxID=67082 RepID=UPI000909CEA9|nr:protein O1 [BeAn 58058 virus]APG58251.1 protein O1 [BeAn 58058 virus]